MSCLLAVVAMLLGTAVFLWAAAEYTRWHPLDLTRRVPQVQKYLMPEGIGLQADKVQLFFDDGPVLRVNGLGVTGPDGTLGVYVEQAAIKLASTQLFLLSAAPKVIEASGVTLRLVRSVDGVSVAGLSLGNQDKDNTKGIVEWLNGMGWDRVWARLRTVRVANINLLVRDDVQKAEWVLEQGNMSASRYNDEGENGTLTAVVRRLYGDAGKLNALDNVPILISFAHGPKADGLVIRGRLDRANAEMVTDYFPPQFKDLLQAQGQVEVGTRVLTRNRIEQPWITMRLTDVKVQPPEGYSKALEFPKLTVTASYVPPVEGLSESDVLSIRELEVETKRGNVFEVSGTIAAVQSDPMIDLRLTSMRGELQGIFDMFPDELRGFAKALKWLRPNIQAGEYLNLRAHYAGKPSAFPGCGDSCGTLDIDTAVQDARVSFLDGISPAKALRGNFQWRGQTMTVTVPEGTIGAQRVDGVTVSMEHIFAVSPTELRVNGDIRGDLNELMEQLGRMPETKGKVPQGLYGQHATKMNLLVPLPRGQEATFEASTLLISSTVANARVTGIPEMKGLDLELPKAAVSMIADKTLRVKGTGQLGGLPMKADWSMNLQPHAPAMMTIAAQGSVSGEWLMKQVPEGVSVTGVLGVGLDLREDKNKTWHFDVKADGSKATVGVEMANITKPRGEPLAVAATGSYAPSGTVVLDKVDIKGNKLAVNGSVLWDPKDIDASRIKLPGLKIGETNVSVDFADGRANVSGTRLDLRGFDLFKGDEDKERESTQPENLLVNLSVNEVMMESGKLEKVATTVKATHGRWDVEKLMAFVEGKRVNVVTTPLRGQAGRKKMVIDIQNLGKTLSVLGIYDKLEGGRMNGEITYDTPDVGGGLVKIEDFELKNPPVLVQLLSLLSLEQLLAGTNSTLFRTATVPVRVDGAVWMLDNASLEGPSMSLRLDGSYNRRSKELNIDGKMAPAIPLNRLVGKIPLLGKLLTGSQDGVVVADFRLKGTAENPEINVRPLSVITPGLLKDFWRGITGDDKDQPKPKVIDGRAK